MAVDGTGDGATLPNFAVIGAARSGTTAITEALRRHPDAFVTTPKEPHYFAFAGTTVCFTGPGDDTGINRNAVTTRCDYLALYDGSADRLARGEGSVSTLYYHQRSIAEISRLTADMRFLVVLRDPVERAFSSFQYLRMRGREPEADFVTAVGLEEERRAAGWHHLWHYSAMSRYADALEAFVAAFGPDRLCVLLYDDIVAAPGRVLQQVYTHLALDPGRAGARRAARVNVSGQARSAAAQTALNRLTSQPRLRNAARRVLPPAARERVRSWNLDSASASARDRAELVPLFSDDLARTEDLLGRRLPRWGRPPG